MTENDKDIEVVVAAELVKLDGAQIKDIYKFLDLESFIEVKETPGKTLKAYSLKWIPNIWILMMKNSWKIKAWASICH